MGAVGSGGLTDGSADLTLGGTAEEVFPQNYGRQYLFVQNVDTAEALWVNFGTAAVADQPSIKLLPGAAIEFSLAGTGVVPTAAVSVIAATTGHPYTAKEA